MEKPDFESMLKKNAFKIHPLDTEKAAVSIDHADWCFEHVWNTHVVPLQRKNDNQAITISEFQKGLGGFVNAPIGKVAFFSEAERYLNDMKSENKALRDEVERLKCELKLNLPNHCVAGQDEVKFCHLRQGDGWKCVHCAD